MKNKILTWGVGILVVGAIVLALASKSTQTIVVENKKDTASEKTVSDTVKDKSEYKAEGIGSSENAGTSGGRVLSASNTSVKWQQLSGDQIGEKFTGMEMTDGVHWRDVYKQDGVLVRYWLGNEVTGTWHVEKNELCINSPGHLTNGCFEVWSSDKGVELRSPNKSIGLEGVLQKSVQ